MIPVSPTSGAVSSTPEALALLSELQAVFDALRSPIGDSPSSPNRTQRDRRRLASRAFLLTLRLQWISAPRRLTPAEGPPCT